MQRTASSFTIQKVKAHVDAHDCTTPFLIWAKTHNDAADHAAKQFNTTLRPSIHLYTRGTFEKERDRQRRFLTSLHDISAQIGQLRAAQKSKQDAPPVIVRDLVVPEVWNEPSQHHIDAFLYGGVFLRRLVHWAQLCGPPDPTAPPLTWVELYVDYMKVTGTEAPVNVNMGSTRPKYVLRDLDDGAAAFHPTLAVMARIFGKAITMAAQLGCFWTPPITTSPVSSLRAYGFRQRLTGPTICPRLALPARVQSYLAAYFHPPDSAPIRTSIGVPAPPDDSFLTPPTHADDRLDFAAKQRLRRALL